MQSFKDKGLVEEVTGAFEDAKMRALSVGADTHREALPVTFFRQGGRPMISGVLPVRVLIRILTHTPSD